MRSQIVLKEMRFYAYHGVSAQELEVGNHFVVNLVITAPLAVAIETDALLHTINYAELYALVKKEMATPSKLLEHVAGRILIALKETFSQLTAAEVTVSKLNPPFGGDVYSASVILNETWG